MAGFQPFRSGRFSVFGDTYFFDASAIVKLVVQEPGAGRAREIFERVAQVYTAWVVVAEALGALKRKWNRGDIDERRYGGAVHLLLAYVSEERLKAVDLTTRVGRPALATFELDILRVRREHPALDAADVLQFAAIRNSFLAYLAGESATQLVSADGALLKAASSVGFRIVDVSHDES